MGRKHKEQYGVNENGLSYETGAWCLLLRSLCQFLVETDIASEPERIRRFEKFFQDITAIILATGSDDKFTAFQEWFEAQRETVRGEHATIPIEKQNIPGSEPTWHSAVKVAISKVEALVESIKGEPGGLTMVVASDVVAFLISEQDGITERTALYNFSRQREQEGGITGTSIEDHLRNLIKYYCRGPSKIEYHVAVAASTKNWRVATGCVVELELEQIPEEFIKKQCGNPRQVSQNFGFNVGIPLVDEGKDFRRFIRRVTIRPLKSFLDHEMELKNPSVAVSTIYDSDELDQLDEADREKVMLLLEKMIKGGVPINIDNLTQIVGRRTGKSTTKPRWTII